MKPQEAATRLGMSYLPAGDKEFRNAWTMIPEISKSGKIAHVMFGDIDGVEVTGFQYSFVMQTGQVPLTVFRTIYSSEIPLVPSILIARRIFLSQILRQMGLFKGIQSGSAEFDALWRIRTGDALFAQSLLTHALRMHIMGKLNLKWRIHSGRLCLIYSGKMKASRIEASLSRLLRFHKLAAPALCADAGEI